MSERVRSFEEFWPYYVLLAPVFGYGAAWVGHFAPRLAPR